MTKVVCAFTWCRFNNDSKCVKESIYMRNKIEDGYHLPICDDFAVKENLVGEGWQRRI